MQIISAHISLSKYIVPEDGNAPVELDVYDFKGPGVALAMYNVDEVCLFRLTALGFFTLVVKIVLYSNIRGLVL